MAKKKIRPFDFSKLKKLSSQYVRITQGLLETYPQFAKEEFAQKFLRELCSGLDFELEARFVGMEEIRQADFVASLSSPCIGIVLQAEPQESRILIELDHGFGCRLVDKLLGGSGESPKEILRLSPMEEGVLEFFIAKALGQLKAGAGLLGPVQLRLIKLAHEAKLMGELQRKDELGIVFKFFLGLGPKGGYFKVYFPHPLVEGVLLREDAVAGVLPPDAEVSQEQRLLRASHVRASLWSEIGRVSLMKSEKDQLEQGDVVLFDETMAHTGQHGISGKTVLRVGENTQSGLLAEVVDSEGKLVVKVLDFYGGE